MAQDPLGAGELLRQHLLLRAGPNGRARRHGGLQWHYGTSGVAMEGLMVAGLGTTK